MKLAVYSASGMSLAAVIALLLLPLATCHMSLINPKPRNAIDSGLPLWKGGKWWPYQPFCDKPRYTPHWMPHDKNWNPQIPSGCVPPGTDGWGCNCANATAPCNVGQSCLWFSDGCSIGCKKCDGLGGNPNTRDRCGRQCIFMVASPHIIDSLLCPSHLPAA